MAISDAETPLLENTFVDGAVDYRDRPALRPSTGRWRSAAYIIGVEIAERFAFFGISANLIMYLTGPLGQSTADAAVNINVWRGIASLMPLLGAFVADSFLGRYRTIAVASLLYILGLGLLSVSAFMTSQSGSDCQTNQNVSCSPSSFQIALLIFSLYLVAVAQGANKPCTQAFGADQFDGDNFEECKAKSSFFNWWAFCGSFGVFLTMLVVSYIQENFSWGLGFGIPCIALVIGLAIFLVGTKTYRFSIIQTEAAPFTRIGRVFVAAFNNWRENPSSMAANNMESGQYNFLNKALRIPNDEQAEGLVCSLAEVEEAKKILRVLSIWGSCLLLGILSAQPLTFFTKQAATMDREILGFKIPAPYIHCISMSSILVSLAIYDRFFVPTARYFTGKPSGITMLQRIGTGYFMSVIVMIVAALVEVKRLKTAQENGLVDDPNATIPMSIWWLAPQCILFGAAEVFSLVGMQEFFYDQVPTELRSIGVALYLSVNGIGSFMSSFLVSIIERATGGNNRDSWFSNNLNVAHLDYFYFLLAGLCALGFAIYLHFARSYIYNRKGLETQD